ncbi:MAG: type III pantothenate kinase [Planctomycetes bacterium]|nr:type III pantothenate kinase [Planctomycetota bacterium]MCH9725881.1 type III pantothenate kinase [Planctomycetota bacterium]MCH9777034.1 type III pantothenate kinase [Planctomycetota bacterium]MCH9789667.1 type III pantothenate kinase [Planctomycetota bacterium]
MSQSLQQLAIDVGNSRIKFILLESDLQAKESKQLPLVLHTCSSLIEKPLPWKQIQSWFKGTSAMKCQTIVAGSNPRGIEGVVDNWPDGTLPTPVEILNSVDFPLEICVDEPRKVGIDRLLNAVAANRLRNSGQATIIIDSGTATTVDVVNPDGSFAGGTILPGFELSAKALHHYTALLPLIPVDELRQVEPVVLGKNTTDAIRSGLFWGQLGAVRELVSQLRDQSLADSSQIVPLVLLTGGGSDLLAPYLEGSIQFEPLLTLQGLALVAQKMNGAR